MIIIVNSAPGEPPRIRAGGVSLELAPGQTLADVNGETDRQSYMYTRLPVNGEPAIPAMANLCAAAHGTYDVVEVPDGSWDDTVPSGSKLWDGSAVVDNPEYEAPVEPEADYAEIDEDQFDEMLAGIDSAKHAAASVHPALARFYLKLDGATGLTPNTKMVMAGIDALEALGLFTKAAVLAAWPREL